MDFKLSMGAISMLMEGKEVEKPVVQVLGTKKISGQGGADRFRLNISDGLHSHTFAMLATQLNTLITDGSLSNNTIIRVDKIIANSVSAKKVFIILELTILAKGGSDITQRIGNPVQYTEENANMANGNGRPGGAPNAPVKREFQPKPAPTFYNQSNAAQPSAANMSFDANFVPIRDLSPYNSKCTIKARVTSKSQIRTWSNVRGDGRLFSIDLVDESGEIRMTGFNNAVDQFYDVLKVNDVYTFSKFSAKPANKQFTTINHDYELSFNNDTSVLPCLDSDSCDIPSVSFNFTEIAAIESCEKNDIVDVIGVCKRRCDLQTITARKDNKELVKRDIILVDRSNTEVSLTLWAKHAEDFDDDTNPVVAIKGARVGDFNGKNLSMGGSATMMVNPDIEEAHVLRGWYDNEGMNMEAKSLAGQRGGAASANAPWKMMREVQVMDPSSADAGFYFKSKVTVLAMKRENAAYKACPEEKCNKKLIETNGLFRCEKCAKDVPNFKWRLILSTCFGDGSDCVWATCFQEQAEMILANSTEYLGTMFSDEPDAFDEIIKKAAFKNYIVKFRAKMETYNNENRVKYSVMDMQPINFLEYSQAMISEIKEITG